jgi:hypothetical protein
MRGVEASRARRLGELLINMSDPDLYDAAIFRAAERLAMFLEARGESEPLRTMPARVRQLHLTEAMHAIRGFESVLDGSMNQTQVAQCFADYHNHRGQLLAAVTCRHIDFPKRDVSGNEVFE